MNSVQILPTPTKSINDTKEYKQIQLPNGLKVLLLSDVSYDLEKLEEEENNKGLLNTGLKKSAAALCIGEIFKSVPAQAQLFIHSFFLLLYLWFRYITVMA